jgi:hypothetical protein
MQAKFDNIEHFLVDKNITLSESNRGPVYEFIKNIIDRLSITEKEKSVDILCQNNFQRMLCHKYAEYRNYRSETIMDDTTIYIDCIRGQYEVDDNRGTLPIPLRGYFGGGCQCWYGLPKRYDKMGRQDYNENRHFNIPWTHKTGVRIILDIPHVINICRKDHQFYFHYLPKHLINYLLQFL